MTANEADAPSNAETLAGCDKITGKPEPFATIWMPFRMATPLPGAPTITTLWPAETLMFVKDTYWTPSCQLVDVAA